MTKKIDQGLESLGAELLRVIEYHEMEYDMTYEAVLGALEIAKAQMLKDLFEEDEEADDVEC